MVVVIIVVAMLAVGIFALWVARNLEHGEARFGPDGKTIAQEEIERPAMRVNVRSGERTEGDGPVND